MLLLHHLLLYEPRGSKRVAVPVPVPLVTTTSVAVTGGSPVPPLPGLVPPLEPLGRRDSLLGGIGVPIPLTSKYY